MDRRRLYLILRPESAGNAARVFRIVHHVTAAIGLAIMLMTTVVPMEAAYGPVLAGGFYVVAAFFMAEYVLRLIAAPEAPGGEHRGELRARLAWALSLGG